MGCGKRLTQFFSTRACVYEGHMLESTKDASSHNKSKEIISSLAVLILWLDHTGIALSLLCLKGCLGGGVVHRILDAGQEMVVFLEQHCFAAA